jgi:hypothetical protein
MERLTADKQRMEQECEDTKVCAQRAAMGVHVLCLLALASLGCGSLPVE